MNFLNNAKITHKQGSGCLHSEEVLSTMQKLHIKQGSGCLYSEEVLSLFFVPLGTHYFLCRYMFIPIDKYLLGPDEWQLLCCQLQLSVILLNCRLLLLKWYCIRVVGYETSLGYNTRAWCFVVV